MFLNRLKRVGELFTSPTYRRMLQCRMYCALLRRVNPGVRYIGLEVDTETFFLHSKDNGVMPWSVATNGGIMWDGVREVIRLCEKFGYPLGKAFLDIGGNIGTSTVCALKSGAFSKGLCVEPSPDNLRLCRLNFFNNDLLDKVKLVPSAVSDQKSRMALTLSAANAGDHRLTGTPTHTSGKTVEVEVDTLDSIMQRHDVRPEDVSIVLVDNQGHEGFVFGGAAKLLDYGVPFSIEFWPQALQEAKCYEQLLSTIEAKFERFIDLSEPGEKTARAVGELRSFVKRFEGTDDATDLFLMPAIRAR